MNAAASTPRAGLESVDKADAVLRVLADAGALSAADIADAVGEPTSSTYRLLTSLVDITLVERAPQRGRFRLGVDLLRIGSVVEDRLSVREAAIPELRRLLAETGLTSFLCIRADDRATCVERFEGRDVRSLALALGQSLPLHRGAAPRALLAFLSPAEREAVVESLRAQGLVEESKAAIAQIVERVRSHGVAVSDGDVTPGIAAIGAPVRDHRGDVVAAMSASGIREQVLGEGADIADRVARAALTTSLALGYEPEEHR